MRADGSLSSSQFGRRQAGCYIQKGSDMNHSEIASFIWSVADLIRDTFKRGKYQDVILPLTVLRRLDSVLAPTKRKVRSRSEMSPPSSTR